MRETFTYLERNTNNAASFLISGILLMIAFYPGLMMAVGSPGPKIRDAASTFEVGTQIRAWTIRVEEMKLDGYTCIDGKFVEEWAVETQGTGTACYSFDNVPGAYDIKITYFDEKDGQGGVTLHIAGEQRASFTLDEDVDGWRWRLFENIQVNRGDEIKLVGQADGAERVRLDFIEFIPNKQPSTDPGNRNAIGREHPFNFGTRNIESRPHNQ